MNINDFLSLANHVATDDLMQVANQITHSLDLAKVDLVATSESVWTCARAVSVDT